MCSDALHWGAHLPCVVLDCSINLDLARIVGCRHSGIFLYLRLFLLHISLYARDDASPLCLVHVRCLIVTPDHLLILALVFIIFENGYEGELIGLF